MSRASTLAKRTRKTTMIQVRSTPEQKALLATAAARAGVSLSAWLLALAIREARAS